MHTTVPADRPGAARSPAGARSAGVGRARDRRRPAREIGFFTIVGHGVIPAAWSTAWSRLARVLRPAARRQAAVARPRPEQSRGYIARGRGESSPTASATAPPDLKEFFAIGPVDVPDDAVLHGAGAPIPRSRRILAGAAGRAPRRSTTAYYRAMDALASRPHAARSRSRSTCRRRFFDDKIDRTSAASASTTIRRRPAPPAPGQLRAGAHTDYGSAHHPARPRTCPAACRC